MSGKNSARLGILMLDSQFPRIPGDVGNPHTWDFAVRYAVVPGAVPDAIVLRDAEPFLQAFIDAGRILVADGCTAIATTCGFLAPMRTRLADSLGVPVAASALEQAQLVKAALPAERALGILTISQAALSNDHLAAAGVPHDSVIAGVEETDFAQSILGNQPSLDVPRARRDLTAAAQRLVKDHPQTGAILLECTNMVPYAPQIAAATELPVYSIYTYLNWFHQSLAPRTFHGD